MDSLFSEHAWREACLINFTVMGRKVRWQPVSKIPSSQIGQEEKKKKYKKKKKKHWEKSKVKPGLTLVIVHTSSAEYKVLILLQVTG